MLMVMCFRRGAVLLAVISMVVTVRAGTAAECDAAMATDPFMDCIIDGQLDDTISTNCVFWKDVTLACKPKVCCTGDAKVVQKKSLDESMEVEDCPTYDWDALCGLKATAASLQASTFTVAIAVIIAFVAAL